MRFARFKLNRRDAAAWTSSNPILLDGELGYEKDTRRLKIGDGSTSWNALPYLLSGISGIGTPAQPEVVVTELGNDAYHKTILTLTNLPITVANTTGKSFGGKKLYDFPKVGLAMAGGVADLTFNWQGTAISLTGSGDFALGTAAAINSNLTGIYRQFGGPWPMVDPFVNGVGRVEISGGNPNFNGMLSALSGIGQGVSTLSMFLNLTIDDLAVPDGASDVVRVTGIIQIPWTNEGAFA